MLRPYQMIAFRTLAAALVLSTLCCCSEKFPDVVARHQSEFDAFKAELASIPAVLPEKPVVVSLSEPLDPAPKFVRDDLAASNVMITPIELLTTPDAKLDKSAQMDFYSNEVKNLFIWADQQDGKAMDSFEPDLMAAFKLRYVVVYRTAAIQVPRMVDEKTYEQGFVVIDVNVYDRVAKRIVCSFPVAAKAEDKVSFQYRENQTASTVGMQHAYSTMWTNAGKALFEKLAENTGGTFDE